MADGGRRKRTPEDRIREGCCPIHGLPIGQVSGWIDGFSRGACPRHDCTYTRAVSEEDLQGWAAVRASGRRRWRGRCRCGWVGTWRASRQAAAIDLLPHVVWARCGAPRTFFEMEHYTDGGSTATDNG